MANSLLSTESCATTPGAGLKTTWTLGGTTNAYAGELSTTDGYSIMASFTWNLLTVTTTAVAGKDCATVACAIGTCIETLDSDGDVIASTVVDEGNMALCHWFHLAAGVVNTVGLNSASTSAYSETRYI